jgi:hypothetical protein
MSHRNHFSTVAPVEQLPRGSRDLALPILVRSCLPGNKKRHQEGGADKDT